jgi:hypothetical protein
MGGLGLGGVGGKWTRLGWEVKLQVDGEGGKG